LCYQVFLPKLRCGNMNDSIKRFVYFELPINLSMKPIFYCLLTVCISVSSYGQQDFVGATHYLFPEFQQGTVLMKDGRVNRALLNYNSLTEEMIFDQQNMKLAIGKQELKNIDTVTITDRKFVVLDNKFVEIVYHSDWVLYMEHKCKVEAEGASTGFGGTSETSAVRSVGTLQTQGRVLYDLELPDGYKTFPHAIY